MGHIICLKQFYNNNIRNDCNVIHVLDLNVMYDKHFPTIISRLSLTTLRKSIYRCNLMYSRLYDCMVCRDRCSSMGFLHGWVHDIQVRGCCMDTGHAYLLSARSCQAGDPARSFPLSDC